MDDVIKLLKELTAIKHNIAFESYEMREVAYFDLDDRDKIYGLTNQALAILEKRPDEIKRQGKIIDSYHTQFKAAMKAQSLGLCKRVIKHALEDEQELKGE